MSKNKICWNVYTEEQANINHSHQILRYLRFRMNQHLPTTIDGYIHFQLGRPNREKIRKIFYNHTENGFAHRRGNDYFLTAKGLDRIRKIDYERAKANYSKFDTKDSIETRAIKMREAGLLKGR